MADYRSPVDEANAQNFGYGQVLSQAQQLAKMFQLQQEKENQQNFDLNKQDREHHLKQEDERAKKEEIDNRLMSMTGAKTPEEALKIAQANGSSVKVGDISFGSDPSLKIHQQDQKQKEKDLSNQSHAIAGVHAQYNKSLQKMQAAEQKIKEGLTLVNDPSQIGSVGAAKSLIISGVAEMNRYNKDEGGDLVPSTSLQSLSDLANKLGDDRNPLADNQRAAINHMFVGALHSLREKHDITRQNAMSGYTTSPYFDESRAKSLKENLGSSFGKQLEDDEQQWGKYGAQAPTMAPPPSGEDQHRGILGSAVHALGNLFSGKKAPQTAAPQASSVPAATPASPQTGLQNMLTHKLAAPQPQVMQQPGPAPVNNTQIRVLHKASGQTGSIPSNEFDPNLYDKVQ